MPRAIPTTTPIVKPRPMRSRLGTTFVAELREEPHLLELDEDRRQARKLRRVGVHRPGLPRGEQRERDRDLGGDLQGVVGAAAHWFASRCDGCQRSTLRSAADETRWMSDAEEPGRERIGVELRVEPVGLREVDLLPEAGNPHEELGREREDQRNGRRDAYARRDVRHGARQPDAVEPLEPADAERARSVDRDRVDVADAVHRLDQQRPERAERREEHLASDVRPEREEEQRDERGRRDRAQELDRDAERAARRNRSSRGRSRSGSQAPRQRGGREPSREPSARTRPRRRSPASATRAPGSSCSSRADPSPR